MKEIKKILLNKKKSEKKNAEIGNKYSNNYNFQMPQAVNQSSNKKKIILQVCDFFR